MYIIKDLQFPDRYFGGSDNSSNPFKFKTLKEVVEQLLLYHEMDCDMKIERKLFNQDKIKQAKNLMEDFGWKIIKIN